MSLIIGGDTWNFRLGVKSVKKAGSSFPSEIREALGIEVGDKVVFRVEDDELRISTLRSRIRRAQRSVRHLAPPGTLVSDELSAERREAAKHE